MFPSLPPQVGVATPFSQGHCPVPPCAPQLLGRRTVRRQIPRLGRRETVLGWGLGSDHAQGVTVKGPPLSPKGGNLGPGGGHQRPALAPLPASGERQNWGNRNRRESEPQLARPQLLLHLPCQELLLPDLGPSLHTTLPLGLQVLKALPVRASWAKYLTSTSWS